MDCPKCKREMMICGFDYTATGDGSPDTPTRLYHVALCECQNPDCEMKGVKFSAGATELPKPNAERRFCAGCGALLAEISDGKVNGGVADREGALGYAATLPESVKPKSISMGGELHITCPVCGREEVLQDTKEK